MPGKGPTPNPSSGRSRGSGKTGNRVIEIRPAEQPPLPTFYMEYPDGTRKKFNWPTITKRWWEMWGRSPLSAEYTENDWAELTDTALIHAKHWMGDPKAAAELRIRTAKFGATPEDRARLRIQFAQADEADEKRRTSKSGADARGAYKGLRAVD